MSPEPFVSHAKALPAKRNEKGYGDENGFSCITGLLPRPIRTMQVSGGLEPNAQVTYQGSFLKHCLESQFITIRLNLISVLKVFSHMPVSWFLSKKIMLLFVLCKE